MIVVVMGVAGSGKTTIGQKLAAELMCPFLDADSLHTGASIEKMSRGVPLTDADRSAWLSTIHFQMVGAATRGQSLVVACSALKQSYRTVLSAGLATVWVYLRAPAGLIRARLRHRSDHFMKADMLERQFEALEEPPDAIAIDASHAPDAIVQEILAALRDTRRIPVAVPPERAAGTSRDT